MQIGLIPPTAELETFCSGRRFHLLLSERLDDPAYLEFYRREQKNGAALCLDNSAHENGCGNDANKLLEQAITVQASEIVCPDELFSATGTITRTAKALDVFVRRASDIADLKCSLMVVPQGTTHKQFEFCLVTLVKILRKSQEHMGFPLVVGLSKDYEMWDGGLYRLIAEHLYPMLGNGAIQGIHCLGWGRQLWKLGRIARDFPLIRSVDSAKPFVFAMSEIALQPGKDVEYPKRPAGYFDLELTRDQRQIAIHNVEIFDAVAQGMDVE